MPWSAFNPFEAFAVSWSSQQRNAIKRSSASQICFRHIPSQIPDYAWEEIWMRRKWEEWGECLKWERQMRVLLGKWKVRLWIQLTWKCSWWLVCVLASLTYYITCLQQDSDKFSLQMNSEYILIIHRLHLVKIYINDLPSSSCQQGLVWFRSSSISTW